VARLRLAFAVLVTQRGDEPGLLLGRKPRGLFRRIRERAQHHEAEHDGRQRFDQEEPLPVAEA
jgi:hypothetical protein